MPEFPPASIEAGHTGLGLVEFHVSDQGKVTYAHALDAPDDAIRAVLEQTLRRWTFHPQEGRGPDGRGRLMPFYSRMIFYFEIVDGKPVVIDAAAELLAEVEKSAVRSVDRAAAQAPATPAAPTASVGAVLSVRDADFPAHPLSPILVLSPSCEFCLNNSEFHKQIIRAARAQGIGLKVLVPKKAAARPYTQGLGVDAADVGEVGEMNRSIRCTPAILDVDQGGVVRKIWAGQLQAPAAAAFLEQMSRHTLLDDRTSSNAVTMKGYRNYSFRELAALRSEQPVRVIDVGERSSSPPAEGILIMPVTEIPFRAPFELDPKALQVIDCSHMKTEM